MKAGRTLVLQGALARLSSCALINRRLVSGLREAGYRVSVFDSEGVGSETRGPSLPDIYVFHGHPFDARSAPGKLNVFVLNYEYEVLERSYQALVARLNAAFDLVIVPADFLTAVLINAGLTIPIAVVPWGFDAREFNPSTPPAQLPTSHSTVFLHLGAVNERKGTDLLLRAFTQEFSAADDVVLVIKEAMRHPGFQKWTERLQRRYTRQSLGPEIVWILGDADSIAGYYTAAHFGVFPHRGEGFGLPILECIASGRRVIVTSGTGPGAFCTSQNSWSVRARRVTRRRRVMLEADLQHLRALLRKAAREKARFTRDVEGISRTVSSWSWQRTIRTFDTALRRHWRVRALRRHATSGRPGLRKPARGSVSPRVAYAFFRKGQTGWMQVTTQIDQCLTARFPGYLPVSYTQPFDPRRLDVLVGLSEFCLERIVKARDANPDVLTVVHQECTVLGDRVAIVNRERSLCGLPLVVARPIELWRNDQENRLADHLLVSSSVAKRFFVSNGFPEGKISVVALGARLGSWTFKRPGKTMRFLFVGTDPLRKGIRVLLEAWRLARLSNAELICLTNLEVLQSPRLLKHLVASPNVAIKPLTTPAALYAQYSSIDCQVLPSLEDTFSLVVADGMGMGKPAIVSNRTGVRDLIEQGVNGYVVDAGSVESLAGAFVAFAENRHGWRIMSEAAYETARQYPWSRFRRQVGGVIESLYRTRQL